MFDWQQATARLTPAKQTNAADDQHCAQQQNPRFRRQKESAYGHDAEYDENEADVFGFFVIADRLFLFTVFIISHNLHPGYSMQPGANM